MMTAARPERVLRKQVRYPHPPEVVWAALTDPDALAQWLMPNNFVPEVGRAFEFRIDPVMGMSVTPCRVLELEPPSRTRGWRGRMVWSWGIQRRPGRPAVEPMRIEWTVEPDAAGTGTVLTLTQHGIERLPWLHGKMMTFGWGTMLKRWLPKVIGAFERRADGALAYRRLEKAPNRGHHGTRTVPEGFSR